MVKNSFLVTFIIKVKVLKFLCKLEKETLTFKQTHTLPLVVFLFSNFVMVSHPQSSARGISQIWVQVREEGRNILESYYILAI